MFRTTLDGRTYMYASTYTEVTMHSTCRLSGLNKIVGNGEFDIKTFFSGSIEAVIAHAHVFLMFAIPVFRLIPLYFNSFIARYCIYLNNIKLPTSAM